MVMVDLLKRAWWKLLLLTLLYAWLSVVNRWFGTSFFIAIAFGIIIGRIVLKTLHRAIVPRSRWYLFASFVTALLCLYLHFAFYTSLNYLENMIFPWQIRTALQAIARAGSDVGGYSIAGQIDFHGSGYYTQWVVESVMVLIAAVVTTHLSE